MSDITKTPKEDLECKNKYLYEYSMFWECKEHSKNQILEEDVCDLLNKFSSEIEELNISISLFEDDVARMSKKIVEQQATIRKLQDLCGESDSENAKLRIENEQLRKDKEQLKERLRECGMRLDRFNCR